MKKRIKLAPPSQPTVPLWMVTFSDTMGLLVCLFVLIIGFSATEKEDRSRAPGMLQGYPGISETDRTGRDSVVEPRDVAGSQIHLSGYQVPPDYDPLSYVRESFLVRAHATRVINTLQYRLTERGFEINILPGELFERDSAKFTARAAEILDTLASACRNLPHGIRIQAYPDDLFLPNDEFVTSESLALRRAAEVCRALHAEGRIPVERLAVATEMHEAATLPAIIDAQVRVVVLRAPKKRAI